MKESIWYCVARFGSLILLQGNFGIPSFRWANLALCLVLHFCLSISWSFVASSLNFSLFYSSSSLNDC